MSDTEEPRPKERKSPPGDFLSEDLKQETARFLDEVKRRIKKRKETTKDPKLGPPPNG